MASAPLPTKPRSIAHRRNTATHPYPGQRTSRFEEPRGSTGMPKGAQDAHIRGGTLHATGLGSVAAIFDDNSPNSPTTIRQARVRRSLKKDIILDRIPKGTVQVNSDSLNYRDHLYEKSSRTPLRTPDPTGPQSYQGVKIGDVGIITEHGSFWFLFNILAEGNSETNHGQAPDGFTPFRWVRDGESVAGDFCDCKSDVDEHTLYNERSQIASPDLSGQTMTEPIRGELTPHSFEGAVLSLPSGASSEIQMKPGLLRHYLEANLENWYKYSNLRVSQELGNGDLHLVYGCDKASAWGMTLFKHQQDDTEQGGKTIYFEPDPAAASGIHIWGSTRGGSSRAWPERGETGHPLDSSDPDAMNVVGDNRPQVDAVVENQRLSIRTINPKFSGEAWKRVVGDAVSADISGSTARLLANPCGPGGISSSSQGGQSSSGVQFSKRPSNSMNYLACNCHFTPVKLHPSERLNNLLLEKHPEASMVITNDDDWTTAADWKGGILTEEDLLWFNDVKIENGVIYLERFTPASSISLPRIRSTPKFKKHPQFYSGQGNLRLTAGRTVFKLRRQDLSPSMNRWTSQASYKNSKANLVVKPWAADDFAALIGARYKRMSRSIRKKEKQRRGAVSEPFQPKSTDLILLVMGATGAGKSTFVNAVAGYDATEVSHGLESCTRKVKAVPCDALEGRRVVIVDTPGFNDTNLADMDVFRLVAQWLKQTYENGVQLSGVIFLHRISDNRLTGAARNLLEVFNDTCGRDALKNAILVTTMWDDIDDEEGSQREKELQKKFWAPMLDYGARCTRFLNTSESAWHAVSMADHASRYPLLLQQEMVEQGMEISRTTAGKTMFGWLTDLLDTIKKRLDDIKAKLQRAMKKGDLKRGNALQAELRNVEEQKSNVDNIIQDYEVISLSENHSQDDRAYAPTSWTQLPLTESPVSIAYSSSSSSLPSSSLPPWLSTPPRMGQEEPQVRASKPYGPRSTSPAFTVASSNPSTLVNLASSHLTYSPSSSIQIEIIPSDTTSTDTSSERTVPPSIGNFSNFSNFSFMSVRRRSDGNALSHGSGPGPSRNDDTSNTHLKVPPAVGGTLHHKKSFLAQARSRVFNTSKLRGSTVESSKPTTSLKGAAEKLQNSLTLPRK